MPTAIATNHSSKQLALYTVIYSPLQMAADLPRNYEANLAAFQFIRDVPVDWEKSKALSGEVGDYIVMARKDKHSSQWFVGGLTDENARVVNLDLDFLDNNTRYKATIYKDGNNAQWETNPYDLIIENKLVSPSDTLTVKMAESGGFAIKFSAL